MITVFPISSGASRDQLVVPVAVPLSPEEVDHFTADTPTLSDAVPLTWMEDAVVDTIEPVGESIVSDGAVVSGLDGGCAGGVGG